MRCLLVCISVHSNNETAGRGVPHRNGARWEQSGTVGRPFGFQGIRKGGFLPEEREKTVPSATPYAGSVGFCHVGTVADSGSRRGGDGRELTQKSSGLIDNFNTKEVAESPGFSKKRKNSAA